MWIYRLSSFLIVAVISLTLRSLLLPPLVQSLRAEELNHTNHQTPTKTIEQQTSQLDP